MKPLVTFALLTYRQERYVIDALKGAVAQDYDNLEIVVSDDCSPDRTFALIQDFVSSYSGPHKIIVNRNETNLGLVGNLNKVLSMAHGEYIVWSAGDDISFPERSKVSYEAILETGIPSISFSYIKIDGDGNIQDAGKNSMNSEIQKFTLGDWLHDRYKSGGCARVTTRKIVEEFGLLNEDCPTEDTTTNLRAFLMGGIGKSDLPLVYYRVHGENVSKGANYYEYVKPQLIYNQYLRDTQTALKKGFISGEEYQLVKEKINYYLLRESSLQTMYYRHSLPKRALYLIGFLFSKKPDWKLKKLMVKRCLSWAKNGF